MWRKTKFQIKSNSLDLRSSLSIGSWSIRAFTWPEEFTIYWLLIDTGLHLTWGVHYLLALDRYGPSLDLRSSLSIGSWWYGPSLDLRSSLSIGSWSRAFTWPEEFTIYWLLIDTGLHLTWGVHYLLALDRYRPSLAWGVHDYCSWSIRANYYWYGILSYWKCYLVNF